MSAALSGSGQRSIEPKRKRPMNTNEPPRGPEIDRSSIVAGRADQLPPAPLQPVQPVSVDGPRLLASPGVSGTAVASLVLGILSFFLPILCSIPSVILGVVSLADIRRSQGRVGGKGLAITGLALSAVSSMLACAFVPVMFFWMTKADFGPQKLTMAGSERSVATTSTRVPGPGQPPPATDFQGLLAYWSLDEGKGMRASDSSGKNNHGTVHGASWTPGIRGTALHFNGPPDYVDYGDAPGLNFQANKPFTFAGWFKTTADLGTLLSQRNAKDGGPDIDLHIAARDLEAVIREDGGEFGNLARVRTSLPVSDGAWHHFALMRRPGGRIDLYLDGRRGASGMGSHAEGAITTNLRALGSERYWVKDGGQRLDRAFFRGSLDEVCIFGRALTDDEIRKLAGR